MKTETAATPTRKQVRETLQANKGEIARLAESLGVSHVTVSLVLKGKNTSKRVYEACQERAIQLLQKGAA